MDPSDSTVVAADKVRYKYSENSVYAVDGACLYAEKGAFIAVLGRNGSGKSTLAKILNALFLPESGSVTICGIDATNEENVYLVRSHCSMVFQNPDNQIVSTIVEEDIAFGPENLGIPSDEIRKRVDSALSAVGLSDKARSAPHMLSGGQKQKVAIAGALAMHSDIIVFDEATAMLDPVGRKDIFRIVKKLNREENITVIWITHFMEEAVDADRVIVMDKGKAVMSGTPREVFADVETITRLGLDVPEAALFADTLRKDGINIPGTILTADEAAEALCQLL